jgi:NRE family putative nickel resistance protein-like MFS transporter
VGTKTIFWGDALTFLLAAGLIFTLPGKLLANSTSQPVRNLAQIRRDIGTGTQCLFGDRLIRYALAMQLVVSLAGAGILVNTVGYVQGVLHLGKLEYGWPMAAFGLGATVASLGLGNTQQQGKRTHLTTVGAVLMSLTILPVPMVNLQGLLLLWAGAGIGQTLVNVPTQTLYHFSKFLTDIELLKSKTIPSNTRACHWIENLKDGKVYFLSYQGS